MPPLTAPAAELLSRLPPSWMAAQSSPIVPVRADPSHAAIYARYSTAGQQESSIERQIEVATTHATRLGLTVVATYVDRARSGATLVGRAGIFDALAGAKNRVYATLIVENVDRVARDIGILGTVHKRLTNLGVELHQAGRGKAGLTDVALGGLLGAETRAELAVRSQFGRERKARDGLAPSGSCFGYERVPGQPGVRRIVEDDAKIIRLIYSLRADRLSITRILDRLRAAGHTLHGRAWRSVTLRQLLRNPTYKGLLIYNRSKRTKNEETGVVSKEARPVEDWAVSEVPEWRIVGDEDWDRVQATFPSKKAAQPRGERPRLNGGASLFSGLIKCEHCGGNYHVLPHHSGARYVCGTRMRTRTCDNGRTVDVRATEHVVLNLIAGLIGSPGYAEAYLDGYNAERAEVEQVVARERNGLVRRVAELNARLTATLDDAIVVGFTGAHLVRMRQMMSAELAEAERALADLPTLREPAAVNPAKVAALGGTIATILRDLPFRPKDEAGDRLASAVRDVVGRIIVRQEEKRTRLCVTLRLTPLVAGGVAAGLGGVEVEASYDRGFQRRLSVEDRRERVRKFLEVTSMALPDEAWEPIAGLITAPAHPVGGFKGEDPARTLSARRLVEAVISARRTGLGARVAESIGLTAREYDVLRERLTYYGIWEDIGRALHDFDPHAFPLDLFRPTPNARVSRPLLRARCGIGQAAGSATQS